MQDQLASIYLGPLPPQHQNTILTEKKQLNPDPDPVGHQMRNPMSQGRPITGGVGPSTMVPISSRPFVPYCYPYPQEQFNMYGKNMQELTDFMMNVRTKNISSALNMIFISFR